MGADGGTIPKRCELVKNKKKKEKINRDIKNASKWRNCKLSQEPLKRPIVACKLGGLYNKEAVLEAILTKKLSQSQCAEHIHSLKDIKELKLTDNKEYKEEADKGDTYKDYNVSPFCCPVTGLAMNGNHEFVVNWHCGCVLSKKAIDEVKSDVCHGCGGNFNHDDLIVLNPTEELLEKYRHKLEEERRMKKKNKQGEKSNEQAKTKSIVSDEHVPAQSTSKRHRPASPINNTSCTEPTKRRVVEKSIQQDENASKVYKSLFTTCEEAKNRPKPNWITYNPLFY
ncbi:hypothetical protein AB6A40_006316 [Gnathostoma spinigerum]|uniref:Replication termination factor 2 n=1 Tax=Gnathostoma spinigerum TaxID=75299 RepID=A0ABD6ESF4_9BILA